MFLSIQSNMNCDDLWEQAWEIGHLIVSHLYHLCFNIPIKIRYISGHKHEHTNTNKDGWKRTYGVDTVNKLVNKLLSPVFSCHKQSLAMNIYQWTTFFLCYKAIGETHLMSLSVKLQHSAKSNVSFLCHSFFRSYLTLKNDYKSLLTSILYILAQYHCFGHMA